MDDQAEHFRRPLRAADTKARVAGAVQIGFGLLFLWASGVHVGIVSGDPGLYHNMADGAWLPGILTAWREVFMAHPGFWGLMVAFGEFAIGSALLSGGRWARSGWTGAVAFHLGLMTLGWGYWLWSIPALVLLLGPGRNQRRPIRVIPRQIMPLPTDEDTEPRPGRTHPWPETFGPDVRNLTGAV